MPPNAQPDPARAAWLPPAGEIVAGRYRLGRTIGSGGMGAVVDAQHVQLGEAVAVKFLHPDLSADAESVGRFVREAQATSRIRSEHVIRMLDVGTTEHGLPYIVMELLHGSDLGKVLQSGPMPLRLAVDCVLQAAEALAEAHAAGIVHRDVKPSNLWLAQRSDGSPLVKVLDFGISKLTTPAGGDARLTETRAVFGSPTYMSPEQIRSSKHVDHRTDVWALGVVLYELLTASLPFEADNVAGVLAAISVDPPRRLRGIRPDAPPELERVVVGCLEKDPSKRASLRDMAIGLRPFASPSGKLAAERIERIGKPVMSLLPPPPSSSEALAPLGMTERDMKWRERGRWRSSVVAGIAGLVALLALVGAGAFAIGQKRTVTPVGSGSGQPIADQPSAHASPVTPSSAIVPVSAPQLATVSTAALVGESDAGAGVRPSPGASPTAQNSRGSGRPIAPTTNGHVAPPPSAPTATAPKQAPTSEAPTPTISEDRK